MNKYLITALAVVTSIAAYATVTAEDDICVRHADGSYTVKDPDDSGSGRRVDNFNHYSLNGKMVIDTVDGPSTICTIVSPGQFGIN